MAFVLFHLPDPVAGLGEVHRVLRPRGLAGFVVWGRSLNLPGFDIWQEELDAMSAAPDSRDPAVMRHAVMDAVDKLAALRRPASQMCEPGLSSSGTNGRRSL